MGLSREDPATPPLVRNLVKACEELLRAPGNVRDMAARVLGRLLTRKDTAHALEDFLGWAGNAVQATDPSAAFLIPGVCSEFAPICDDTYL